MHFFRGNYGPAAPAWQHEVHWDVKRQTACLWRCTVWVWWLPVTLYSLGVVTACDAVQSGCGDCLWRCTVWVWWLPVTLYSLGVVIVTLYWSGCGDWICTSLDVVTAGDFVQVWVWWLPVTIQVCVWWLWLCTGLGVVTACDLVHIWVWWLPVTLYRSVCGDYKSVCGDYQWLCTGLCGDCDCTGLGVATACSFVHDCVWWLTLYRPVCGECTSVTIFPVRRHIASERYTAKEVKR